jgi:halimadienyl-diphosphate synthase
LEAFSEHIDPQRAGRLLLSNGSVAVSPSATAYLLNQTPTWGEEYPQSKAYLETLLNNHNHGLPHVAPYDIFAQAWMLAYLDHGSLRAVHAAQTQSYDDDLLARWRPEGVGYSSLFIPDADCTSLTLAVLHKAGYDVDGRCLLAYERDENFACLKYERNPSLSVQLHILSALATLPAADQPRVCDKILRYLLHVRRDGAYWSDKWHASVYYPTSRALTILSPYLPEQMRDTLRWLLATQHPNGAWGQYMPTLEETALVLLALLQYHHTCQPVSVEPMQRAAQYLLEHEQPFAQHYPALWIGKALYTPTPVIRSCILGALGLYAETFPGSV